MEGKLLKSLLTKEVIESFWYEVEQREAACKKEKIVTERECQRILVTCLRCFHPGIFILHTSDTPTVVSSSGYDIQVISSDKTCFIEAKLLKNFKIQSSQIAFSNEVKGFDFIEYAFLIFELGDKKNLYLYHR